MQPDFCHRVAFTAHAVASAIVILTHRYPIDEIKANEKSNRTRIDSNWKICSQ